jgi:hypothetical protein
VQWLFWQLSICLPRTESKTEINKRLSPDDWDSGDVFSSLHAKIASAVRLLKIRVNAGHTHEHSGDVIQALDSIVATSIRSVLDVYVHTNAAASDQATDYNSPPSLGAAFNNCTYAGDSFWAVMGSATDHDKINPIASNC